MSTYQQVPVGIPVSSNPYPSHPYTANFPDEPDTETPQIPPPIENNQQYYPQQNFPIQDPVAMGQPIQSFGVGQVYGQPASYVMVMNPAVVADPEKKKLERKIRDLEKKLEKGWYSAYYNWLVFVMLYSGFGIVQYVMTGCIFVVIGEFKIPPVIAMCVLGIANSIWFVQQASVGKNAITGKNLEGMKRGLKSMSGFAVFYFFTFIGYLVILDFIIKDIGLGDENWIGLYVVLFVVAYIIPVSINIFGAKKVIGVLETREELVLECKNKYGGDDVNMA